GSTTCGSSRSRSARAGRRCGSGAVRCTRGCFGGSRRTAPASIRSGPWAMVEAGRDPAELELVGGTRGRFTGPVGVADLDTAIAQIPPQLARGFTTICVKPSQFVRDAREVGAFCREVVRRVRELVVGGAS